MISERLTRWAHRHRGILSAAGAGLAAALFFAVIFSPRVVGAAATRRELPVYCVDRQEKLVSLTFDAAWGNEDTQKLIDILGRYGVKATFFLVGQWVDRYPESVKALHDAGHEVMNHSDTHPHMSKLSPQGVCAEVDRCSDKIEAITGVRPTLFRCPYGEYDDNVISAIRSLGVTPIQWNVDSLDWKELPAGEIQARVTGKVVPGSIVLFHNAGLHTPEALPGIIEFLQKEGYTIVPVSQILLSGNTSIDHTGKQHAAA